MFRVVWNNFHHFRVVLISAIILCYQMLKRRASNLYERNNFLCFFSLPRLYLTLATIKTSECSTLGRCILKRVRFRYKNVCDKSFEKTPLSSLLSDWLCLFFLFTFFKLDNRCIWYITQCRHIPNQYRSYILAVHNKMRKAFSWQY